MNLSESTSGFWDSLFNLFGSSSDYETELEGSISNAHPIMKIDLGKTTLAHSAEDYKVEEVPFIIAFHKNVQVLKETPTLETSDKLTRIVKDIDEKNIRKAKIEAEIYQPNADQTVPLKEKVESDVKNQPQPLVIIPDFNKITTTDIVNSIVPEIKPIEIFDKQTGANLQDNIDKTQKKATETKDKLIEFKTKAEEILKDPVAAAKEIVLKPSEEKPAASSTTVSAAAPSATAPAAAGAVAQSSPSQVSVAPRSPAVSQANPATRPQASARPAAHSGIYSVSKLGERGNSVRARLNAMISEGHTHRR